MQPKTNQIGAKLRSVFLVFIMVFSTTAAFATNASASAARNYTTNRDPIDIGIADFNCDGFNDMAIATDGTHTITILTNDGTGDFTDRYDVWVSKNTSRNAEWDEFSNVQFLEIGEFTGDSERQAGDRDVIAALLMECDGATAPPNKVRRVGTDYQN